MEWDEDDYGVDLTEDDIENIAFESLFYELLTGTTEIQVVPMPDIDGFIIPEEDLKIIKNECIKAEIKLIYRISHGKVATIFDPKTLKTGVIPEFNLIGFPC
jgi:hypothetical protein